jgi:hypothetical protein
MGRRPAGGGRARSARYTKTTTLASSGDAISGNAAIDYAPGAAPPWNIALGLQYSFSALQHDGFVRLDWEYASRNPWLAAVQDPNSSQYNPYSRTLPGIQFASLRLGTNFGNWSVAAFVDNLFDTRTTLNYALVQNDLGNVDANGNPQLRPQQNSFAYRPRTVGINVNFRN